MIILFHIIFSQSNYETVLEELEGDGTIHIEKIGTAKYVWSFPSEDRVRNKTKLGKLENELKEIESEMTKWSNKLETVREERKDPEREKNLGGIAKLQTEIDQTKAKISGFEGCEPEKYKEYQQGLQVAKDAAERWTDNVFQICKFITSKNSMKQREILDKFQFPADFDYLE